MDHMNESIVLDNMTWDISKCCLHYWFYEDFLNLEWIMLMEKNMLLFTCMQITFPFKLQKLGKQKSQRIVGAWLYSMNTYVGVWSTELKIVQMRKHA